MTWVEATVLAVALVGIGVLLDRARHPSRYAPLDNVSRLKCSLMWTAGLTTVGTAAAGLGGSSDVAQVVAGVGLLVILFLLYMLTWAIWRPR